MSIYTNRLPIGSPALPPEFQDMADNVPACFNHETWVLWLGDTWGKPLDNTRERLDMANGVVPDFCAECTAEHRAAMVRAGRCERAAGLLDRGKRCKIK